MEQPVNETKSESSRTTISGRRLTYKLQVVQQPEKARACGAGQRCMSAVPSGRSRLTRAASQDRRPVDPPPVVELSVLDENNNDITMNYDAGFMLFASLEMARPIAHGRIHNAPIIPVLTGVAVASAAYLERPKKAAYFIFPDLSVRHEGWYRLKFSLFEQIKHAQDADPDRPFQDVPASTEEQRTAPVRHESMANRMEVLSIPFQVYSAKKFPGLNTSTALSKVVADQGCRVRIRRDIRQRKHGVKKVDTDVMDDATISLHGTPQLAFQPLDHSRPGSRNSFGSQYEAERLRRASIESLYNRPVLPSRHPSISSVTMPSPTPNATMPPPPTFSNAPMSRPALEPGYPSTGYGPTPRPSEPRPYASTPAHAQPQPFLRPITPDPEHNVTLPPLNLSNGKPVSYNHSTRLYNLPEATASKRSCSPNRYDQHTSMKAGARPDIAFSQPKWGAAHISPAGPSVMIEPDNGQDGDEDSDDSLLHGALIYHRADGTTGNKVAQLYARAR